MIFDLDDPEQVDAYDELPLWSAPFALALFEAVRLRPGLEALDVGCGTGFPLLELQQRLGPGARVVGIDPWAAGLARARRKARRYGLDALVVRAAAERMPFADGRFGLVVSNNGINNVADPARALAECFRVAAPGAQLVATVNLPDTMKELYDALGALLRERGREALLPAVRAHIAARRKPRAETEQLLEAAGWELRDVREEAFRLRFAGGAALFRHYFIRLAFLPAWREILPAGEADDFFAELEAGLGGELSLTVPFACFDAVRR